MVCISPVGGPKYSELGFVALCLTYNGVVASAIVVESMFGPKNVNKKNVDLGPETVNYEIANDTWAQLLKSNQNSGPSLGPNFQ